MDEDSVNITGWVKRGFGFGLGFVTATIVLWFMLFVWYITVGRRLIPGLLS